MLKRPLISKLRYLSLAVTLIGISMADPFQLRAGEPSNSFLTPSYVVLSLEGERLPAKLQQIDAEWKRPITRMRQADRDLVTRAYGVGDLVTKWAELYRTSAEAEKERLTIHLSNRVIQPIPNSHPTTLKRLDREHIRWSKEEILIHTDLQAHEEIARQLHVWRDSNIAELSFHCRLLFRQTQDLLEYEKSSGRSLPVGKVQSLSAEKADEVWNALKAQYSDGQNLTCPTVVAPNGAALLTSLGCLARFTAMHQQDTNRFQVRYEHAAQPTAARFPFTQELLERQDETHEDLSCQEGELALASGDTLLLTTPCSWNGSGEWMVLLFLEIAVLPR